jgi:TctA family transporter
MVLLGLLFGIVGQDVNTGVARLMFGLETLTDGLSLWAMLLGFAITDGALYIVSPSLLLTIYARKFGLRFAATSLPRGSLARIAGALLIAAALHESDILEDTELIGQIASFVVLGLACQLLGWNRLVLLVACLLGRSLEESIRSAVMLTKGDFDYLLSRQIEGTMLLIAVVVFTIAVALSAWRTITRPQSRHMIGEANTVESSSRPTRPLTNERHGSRIQTVRLASRLLLRTRTR